MLESQSCLISRALPSSCEQESKWAYMTCHLLEITSSKLTQSEESPESKEPSKWKRPKSDKHLDSTCSEKGLELPPIPPLQVDRSDCEDTDSHMQNSEGNSLISPIGRDTSIKCLMHCSRSDYGSLASVNQAFRSLIRSGELYRLRRQEAITEHWVYFSCDLLQWEAYDPYRSHWLTLPMMPRLDNFMTNDKESLAVGTELLVFGTQYGSQIIMRYSILTNSWSAGVPMNSPRCLFGSTSFGEKAIVAGGTDNAGNILCSAELYDSENHTWTVLASMNKPRKMCSGIFMDNKFYVLGGLSKDGELLQCGEEYDLHNNTWTVIPNMASGLHGPNGAPPLLAVVSGELYAAAYAEKRVRKYDKDNNTWITLGNLPERPDSVNGWGLAFRGCGDRVIVIGGPRFLGGRMIELNSWTPREGPPQWNLLATKHSGSFVYNCAVMSC